MEETTMGDVIKSRVKELEQEFDSLAKNKSLLSEQIEKAREEIIKMNTRQLQIQGAIDELKKLSMPPKVKKVTK